MADYTYKANEYFYIHSNVDVNGKHEDYVRFLTEKLSYCSLNDYELDNGTTGYNSGFANKIIASLPKVPTKLVSTDFKVEALVYNVNIDSDKLNQIIAFAKEENLNELVDILTNLELKDDAAMTVLMTDFEQLGPGDEDW